MRQNMRLERVKIGVRRFGRGKSQRGQPAGRVVGEHDQRATGAAPLQPVVRTAVDLNQLAKAPAPFARPMHPPRPPPCGPRKPKPDLQAAHRLARNHDPVQLTELLRRQRRPEIRILVCKQPLDPNP